MPIRSVRAWSASALALAQADDQLLAPLTDEGIDRGVDHLATDVGVFQAGYVHAAQLAGNLLRETNIHASLGHPFEAFIPRW